MSAEKFSQCLTLLQQSPRDYLPESLFIRALFFWGRAPKLGPTPKAWVFGLKPTAKTVNARASASNPFRTMG